MKALFSTFISSLIFTSNLFSVASAASPELPYRVGPASAALGGAGRAGADPSEAGWLNPATLVHVRSYHFSVSHQQSHRDTGDGYRDFGLMLADGGEDKLAAGSFGYVQRSTLRGGAGAIASEQKDLQASVAAFLPGERISLGLGYRRLIHAQPGNDITQDTFTLGMLMPFGDTFGIGLVGQDLAGGSSSAPPEARLIPSFGVGMHATFASILQVRADVIRLLRENPGARSDVRLGLESWFRPDFAFRLGGAWLENRDETWLTTGIGFKGPRLSFGYAFEKEIRTTNGTRHTFDLWLPL